MDPYNILSVSRNASDEEIKKAYRKLASTHHPDMGGNEEEFKELNKAYSMINTEEKRAELEYSSSFGGFGNMFGNFGDIFEGFFGNRAAARNTREHSDEDIVFDMKISLAQIKEGLSQNIVFTRNKKCHRCSGAGGKNKTICTACNGSGAQVIRVGPVIQQSTCRTCYGSRFHFEEKCESCAGAGAVQVEENIKFTIKNNM